MTADEASLVARARKGDAAALATVLKRYERPLYASAYAVLGSSWDALDAVQETMLEACAKIGTLRDAQKFRQWLTVILVNKAHDRLRQLARETPVGDPHELSAHVFVGSERDHLVIEAVRELDDEQRLAVALRFFLDLRYEEIAAATGWPIGTAKSRVSRALTHLRQVLAVVEAG
jgi:RNA polymerase sigma factor (sigma-70 family)